MSTELPLSSTGNGNPTEAGTGGRADEEASSQALNDQAPVVSFSANTSEAEANDTFDSSSKLAELHNPDEHHETSIIAPETSEKSPAKKTPPLSNLTIQSVSDGGGENFAEHGVVFYDVDQVLSSSTLGDCSAGEHLDKYEEEIVLLNSSDGEDHRSSDADSSAHSPYDRKVSFRGVRTSERHIMESLQLLAGESSDDPSTHGSVTSIKSSQSSLMEEVFGPNHKDFADSSGRRPSASVRFEQNRRTSLVRDLETGKEGVRGHRAIVRTESSLIPQSPFTRRRRGLGKLGKKLVNPFWGVEEDNESDNCDDSMLSNMSVRGRLVVNRIPHQDDVDRASGIEEEIGDEESQSQNNKTRRRSTQYRLQALDSSKKSNALLRVANHVGLHGGISIGIYEDTLNNKSSCQLFGFRPNEVVYTYLNWAFRSSFLAVALSACAAFYFLTISFALVIMGIGYHRPDCIYVNGEYFGVTGGAAFVDAYALSWTTFTTVGYGAIYPGTSKVSEDIMACTGITILTTMEAFVGLLFASMCGAIFFAKVSRVASVAQVEFSDPIVIRYGSGLMGADDESSSEEEGARESASDSGSGSFSLDVELEDSKGDGFQFTPSKLPCPLIEFRVVNSRSGRHGGEIIDATMNLVASIDDSQASQALRNAVRGPRRRGKKGKRRGLRRQGAGSATGASFVAPTRDRLEKAQETLRSLISNTRVHQTMEEDPTGKLVAKKIFVKLELESQEHPFFKRVWHVRHVLDQHSPLLRQEAKELIRLNGGHWPVEMNTPEAVRASVHFDQIVVSLSGTSNADANSVYAQKVYEYVDLCVGYRFCDILFRDYDGTIQVDHSLLNDVKEQHGGGGEDLRTRAQEKRHSHIMIL